MEETMRRLIEANLCSISMTVCFLLLTSIISVFAQPNPDTLWTSVYGGSSNESGASILQTTDNRYTLAGWTGSFGAGGDDFYLVRIDTTGDTLWTRTYGGSNDDRVYSVKQTSEGGYILAGETESFGALQYNIYLVRTDSIGDTLWTSVIGDTGVDRAFSMQITADGGFILAGCTNSFGAGLDDFYLVKTNSAGDTLWTRTYGGSAMDVAWSVQQTLDGGYIVAGYTESFGAGSADLYVVKTDSNGDTLWTRTYGGSYDDGAHCVLQTFEGGYAVIGYTESFGGGQADVYFVRTNSFGDTLWTRIYGGSGYEHALFADQTSDSGLIITGWTGFGPVERDFYIIRVDSIGNAMWTRIYGGSLNEIARAVQQTSDGGYVVAGWTASYGHGDDDCWVIKLESEDGTYVCGDVSGTWTAAGNPYKVICEINVPAGNSLIIEPGVDIQFHGFHKLYVNGHISAIGTPEDSIRFIRGYDVTYWNGIYFTDIASDSSKLEYCLINGTGSADPAIQLVYANPTINHCSVVGNNRNGIYCNQSSPVISNCVVSDNVTGVPENGAGIACNHYSNPTILNCLITSNNATWDGGGINCWDHSSPTITNCTIVGNHASNGGGLQAANASYPVGVNNIIWGNSDQISGTGFTCAYSDIQDGYTGEGNINLDPFFVDPSNGDYHLQSVVGSYHNNLWLPDLLHSPCIDAGHTDSSFVNEPAPNGGRVNMGVYGNSIQASLSNICGEVWGTWTVAHSPYHVTCDITVPTGDTLIIEPGVDVIFEGHFKLTVNGLLKAEGMQTDSITFTPADTSVGWGGIRICSAHDSCKLEYCVIEYGKVPGGGLDARGGGIRCVTSSPLIRHCSIRNNEADNSGGGGIACDSSSNPTIVHSQIVNNTSINADGGGIDCSWDSNPIIDDCDIINNSANNGGGIYCYSNSNATLRRNLIIENSSLVHGGGVFVVSSNTTLDSCTIFDNYSGDGGGGLYFLSDSDSIVSNCTIQYNHTDGYGGGADCNAASPSFIACSFDSNSCTQSGGALYLTDGNLSSIDGCDFIGNSAGSSGGNGGAIYCYLNSSPTITGNTFQGNTTGHNGGAISCNQSSSPMISGNLISNNRTLGGDGGGISCDNSCDAIIYSNDILDNTANHEGGGIYCYNNSNAAVKHNTISGNKAVTGHGGGIYCESASPSIMFNIIDHDSAGTTGVSGNGGGIYFTSSSPDSIADNTISNNYATHNGGGISCRNGSSPDIYNNLIVGNVCGNTPTLGDGGGIECLSSSSPYIYSNTIAYNHNNDHGGGVYCDGTSPNIKNCILWGNSPDQVFPIGGANPQVTYCDVQDSNWLDPTNIHTDPIFVNGYYLSQTTCEDTLSPCVDAGDPSSLLIDGTTRIDHGCDVGNLDLGYHYPDCDSPLMINLTYPNGGEMWRVGDTPTITWTHDSGFDRFDVMLSRDGGSTWDTLDSGLYGFAIDWTWNAGVTPPETDCALVKIVGHYGLAYTCDVSDSCIEIEPFPPGNYAIHLNGSTGYGEVPHHESINFTTGDFTLEAIIRQDSIISWRDAVVFGKSDGPSQPYYKLETIGGMSGNAGKVIFGYRSSTYIENTILSDIPITLGDTVHIAGVKEGDSIRVYIDGILRGINSCVDNPSSTGSLGIGEWIQGDSRHFPGIIDEVRLWNDARSPEELNQYMCQSLSGSEANLAAYYTFNEGYGTVFGDSSANNNDGILYVGYTWITSGWGCPFSISGNIQYYDLTSAIPNTMVDLIGTVSHSATTDDEGYYQFSDLSGDNYTIIPSREDTTYSGVETNDCVAIRNHLAQIDTFNSPFQHFAGDVNTTGNVSIADVIKIRRHLAELDTLSSGNWNFVDAGFPITFTNWASAPNSRSLNLVSDTTDQDFIGVRMGDVNTSWSSSGLDNLNTSRTRTIALQIGNEINISGSSVTIPVSAYGLANAAGIELHFLFSNNAFEFRSATSDYVNNPTVNSVDNRIHFVWDDIDDLVTVPEGGVLAKLLFDFIGDQEESPFIEFDRANICDASAISLQLEFTDEPVNVIGPDYMKPIAEFRLNQNYPNPFNPVTLISFDLPQKVHVTLKIYNILGQTVAELVNREMDSGRHYYRFDATKLSSGIYFYSMKAGDFEDLRKMVVIK